MSEGNKNVVRRYYEEVWSQGRLDEVDALVAPTVVVNGNSLTPEKVRQAIGGGRASFPDQKYALQDVIAEGDLVAVRWTWEGTQTGEFHGKAPSGTHVTYTGMGFFRIASDKIVEHWSNIDQLGLLQQLGLVTQS